MKTKKENSKKECWNRQRDMISKITSILVSDSDLTIGETRRKLRGFSPC